MKIGDKVRFLSETGGGTVCGFREKDIVLVEDENGFQIPMAKSQVVVIDEERDKKSVGEAPMPAPRPAPVAAKTEVKKTASPARRLPVKPAVSLYLSFVPLDVKTISSCRFDTYLVNDSDYHLTVLYASAEGGSWRLRFCEQIEPNTKVFVEELDRAELEGMERLSFQILAWKKERLFARKDPFTVELRLDLPQFYKLHLFQPDEFFSDPCMTLPIVEADRPAHSAFVDTDTLRETLLTRFPKKK